MAAQQTPFLSTAEINTFCDRYIIPTIVDQRYQARPIIGIMRAKKRLVTIDGGSIVAQPILAQPNQTAIVYIGADILPTDYQEEFTSFEVPWKQLQTSVTIVSLDKIRTSGRTAQLNFIKDKVESAYMAAFDLLGAQVFKNGTGSGGKDWDGLLGAINDASGFQTYFGIDRIANPWWQAQVFDPGSSTALSTASMMTLFLAASTDMERPQLVSTTKTGYGSYWQLLTPQEIYVTQEVGNLGFENIAFQGCPVVYDAGNPANTMYFHNLDHEILYLSEQENFTFSGFTTPTNQNVDVGHIFVTGNMYVRKPAATGVYRNISNA